MDHNLEVHALSSKWLEALAVDEINLEETGIIDFNDHIDPSLSLEESSIEMTEALKELFEIFVTKFNRYRGDATKEIKMFRISNTVNDFMLFRNSLKLVISRKAQDLIQVGFMGNNGGYFTTREEDTNSFKTFHELRASTGPFNDIIWRYQDEKINPQALVKFYLTEFIKQSAQ